ncbi:PAS domain S-box protein (plasmid) [Haloferax larsenii]|uniref:histidine kinase n=1 Tax=Haloferax larsenii TaxID=302484 RepID=A0ABY5RL72_HALLR|nr:PAS domain S-box protein [Haloferax larsenii]UVE52275.1 PAS domain S-box protein [Haloferax larsenii]
MVERHGRGLVRKLGGSLTTFEEAVESATVAIYFTGPDGTISYVNPAFEVFTGYCADEAIGETPAILDSGEHDEEFFEDLWETILDGRVWEGEIHNRRKDGSTYVADQTIAPIVRDGEISGFAAIQVDITDRKQDNLELRTFEQAVEYAGHSLIVTDTQGRIEYVNPAFEEITGYSREEAIGSTPAILNSGEHDDEFYRRLWETILSGEVWHAELVNERRDGERFIVDQTIAPILDDEGDIERFVAVNRDITDRKEIERKLLNQRDDLEILNQVVRHDIRNDLQLVVAYAEMLEDHVDDAGQPFLDKVRTSADNAVELTKTARVLSDVMLQTDAERTAVSLPGALESKVREVGSAHDHATVSVTGSVPDVDVWADELLESVFRNLLRNAVQHNDKDEPVVTVSVTTHDDSVSIRVRDNGPGIPDSRKDEIFGKGEKGIDSPGTGLGLYLVGTLVDRYGGSVDVFDADPEGSIFQVELERV